MTTTRWTDGGRFGGRSGRGRAVARRGGVSERSVRAVDETRRKVRELNELVVSALVAGGDAEGVAVEGEGWGSGGGQRQVDGGRGVEMCAKGIVPVIHGDVVRDAVQGTSVLMGRHRHGADRWRAGRAPPPSRVLFHVLTSTRDPNVRRRRFRRIRRHRVSEDEGGVTSRHRHRREQFVEVRLSVAARRQAAPRDAVPSPTFTVADGVEDVTGGVETKLAAAVAIVVASAHRRTSHFLAAGAFAPPLAPWRNPPSTPSSVIRARRTDDDDDITIDRFVGTRVRRVASAT